ncbi:hypothetical protein GOV12_00895 [Candidatus Pacearchaeota archaeon]|nr:hypothetical protein [Candidatus Pacearchaeota archaeon]
MKEFKSKKDQGLAYVFDEFKLSGESLEEYELGKRLDISGVVTRTEEVSFDSSKASGNDDLVALFEDLLNFPPELLPSGRGGLSGTLDYINRMLDQGPLVRNNYHVHIHYVNTQPPESSSA